MERTRYGRRGKRQHVEIALQVLNLFLMANTKSLFFIDYKQTGIFILNAVAQKHMCPHNHIGFSRSKLLFNELYLFFRLKTRQKPDRHGEARETRHCRVVMLLSKYCGRYEKNHLHRVHYRLECRPQRHLRLAVAHVAAQKSVHDLRAFHISLYLLYTC